ncbi:MAG: acyl carrier protein [Acidimicrobiales bacterium]
MLDRSTFIERFAEEFELKSAPVGSDRVIGDLGFDSLEVMRLVLFMEIVCGVELPEQVDMETLNVEDVWHYYQVQASRAGSDGQ